MPLPPAADPAPGGVSAALWASARPAALACAHTPFMRHLADGSLPPGAWRDYIGQDFFFLRAFKAAYDAAAAAAGDGGDATVLRRLSAAVDDELQLHKGVAAGLKIDLASIVAAPATASYCAFLAAAAATGHVPSILSAMAPCSRLYGWLGVRLADAASAAGVDLKAHPYGDWVRTYASADYHAAPAAKEALLDRLVAAGGVDQARLASLYTAAMAHELAFFQGTDTPPRPLPAALIVDFDDTLTTRDTTPTVIGAALAAAPTAAARAAAEATRDALVAQYVAEREGVLRAALPTADDGDGAPRPYDAAATASFLAALSSFDRAANARAFASGLLAGATPAALADAGAAVPLRPGAAATLARALAAGVPTAVLSVSWSTELVVGALRAAGLVQAARATAWPLAPALRGPLTVAANDVAPDASGTVVRRVECAEDKAAAFGRLVAGAGRPTVYVGDAASDVGALLAADVGVVVGDSPTTRRVLAGLGVALVPLAGAPAEPGRREGASAAPTLYHAAGWDEIEAALFPAPSPAPASSPPPPRVLSIAGSDSGGGAGIQADVKTCAALGVYAATAITAITVQNTAGVAAVHTLPPELVTAQIAAVLDDLGADAVKTGMLGDAAVVAAVADLLAARPAPRPPLVVDPVLVATSGDALATDAVAGAVAARLLPLATVVTPNLAEAAALLGRPVADLATLDGRVAAAADLVALGPRWALVKGGHADADGDDCVDVLHDGGAAPILLRAPRVPTSVSHGTGCTLASALAAGLARGLTVPAAAAAAKRYVGAALAASSGTRLGGGPQWPMHHAFATAGWGDRAAGWPLGAPPDYRLYVVTDPRLDAAAARPAAAAVAAAVAGGATVVQVRAKDADAASLAADAAACVAAAGARAPVLVNDRADVAAGVAAAGAHVGQSDLPASAARAALGPLRVLGVSVKTVAQARAAAAAGASYVGCGAVFPTGTKADASVIGVEGLAAVCAAVSIPVVAIGGVTAANAAACIEAGAAGVAVVSAVFGAPDVEGAARKLRAVVDAALERREAGRREAEAA